MTPPTGWPSRPTRAVPGRSTPGTGPRGPIAGSPTTQSAWPAAPARPTARASCGSTTPPATRSATGWSSPSPAPPGRRSGTQPGRRSGTQPGLEDCWLRAWTTPGARAWPWARTWWSSAPHPTTGTPCMCARAAPRPGSCTATPRPSRSPGSHGTRPCWLSSTPNTVTTCTWPSGSSSPGRAGPSPSSGTVPAWGWRSRDGHPWPAINAWPWSTSAKVATARRCGTWPPACAVTSPSTCRAT